MPPHALDDRELAVAIARGDDDAFAALYDRHAAKLLSFCRYLLGSRDEAQDAVQQTFMRAHQALRAGKLPDELRPWLYTIARNRCRTMLAARRGVEVPVDELEGRPAVDGLADEVQRREDLRALVRDLDGLPEDQRAALVLFELGDLSQRDVAGVLAVPEAKVKALVHQARAHLIAERAARERPCEDVRAELAVASGGALRRGPLRRHLKSCAACRAYQEDVTHQRAAIAAVLPVMALAGSRESLLHALGISASAGSAAGAAGTFGGGAVSAVSAGAAAGGSAGAGAGAGAGGILSALGAGSAATKVAATVAAVAAVGGGAAGTRAVLHAGHDTPATTHAVPASGTPAAAPTTTAFPGAAATHSANAPGVVKPGQQRHARGRSRAAERREAAAQRKAAHTPAAASTSAPGHAGTSASTAQPKAAAKAKARIHRPAKPQTHRATTRPAHAKVQRTSPTHVRPIGPAKTAPARPTSTTESTTSSATSTATTTETTVAPTRGKSPTG